MVGVNQRPVGPAAAAAAAAAVASPVPAESSVSPALSAEAEALISKAPYQHSFRYAPPKWTAISCMFFLIFFYQVSCGHQLPLGSLITACELHVCS
jgi:hypothetical protein